MIPDTETLLPLADACKLVPPRGVSPSTLVRWIQSGRLAAVRGPRGAYLTSREAIRRALRPVIVAPMPVAPARPGVGEAALAAGLRELRRARNAGKARNAGAAPSASG